MNITTKQVLQHFLSQLVQELAEIPVHGHHPIFDHFFTKDEIIKIVEHLYQGTEKGIYNMDTVSKTELLDELSDADILEYFIDQWELGASVLLSSRKVHEVLNQLGLQTHYLNHKMIAQWDEYDHANYRSLLVKAGRMQKAYGIYDSSIQQEDVDTVTSPPQRFYDSYEQAEVALQELTQANNMKSNEVHILYTYKAI